MIPADTRKLSGFLLAAIIVVTVGCYFQVYDFEFVYDSFVYVFHDPYIRQFSLFNTIWIFTHAWIMEWQPLTWLSHTLDFELFGNWAGGPHLENVILHLLNSVLLYFLMLRLFRYSRQSSGSVRWIAGITAFIFALHPQHVESVAMIAQRKDMLYGLFTIICTFAYLQLDVFASSTPESRRWRRRLAVFYLLDLLAKPMAVTLPVIFIAMDVLLLKRVTTSRTLIASILDKSYMIVLAILISIITLITQRSAMISWKSFTILERVAHAVHNMGFYSWKFLFPVNLSPFYPFPPLHTLLHPGYWLPALSFLLATTLACAYAWRLGRPAFMFGWIYFLLTMAPVNGFVQVGTATATDHYVYMATIPFGAFLGWLAVVSVQRIRLLRPLVISVTGCYLVGLVLLTWTQIGFWQSPFRLWGRALALYPQAQLPRHNLAIAYMQAGAYHKALAEALKMSPPEPIFIEKIKHDMKNSSD